ncbi:hypothetical protein BX666DRAFT_1905045 [Dichotomocladium elegans]|nr:hypothetical protein BX666DRAFT_1905045 [Dichotomocladium elegans]
MVCITPFTSFMPLQTHKHTHTCIHTFISVKHLIHHGPPAQSSFFASTHYQMMRCTQGAESNAYGMTFTCC